VGKTNTAFYPNCPPLKPPPTTADTLRRVLYFFRRGPDEMSCETRLNPDGPGFQLVVVENDRQRVEDFDELPMLLSREHELLQAWRAQGWREIGAPSPTPVDTWSGPR